MKKNIYIFLQIIIIVILIALNFRQCKMSKQDNRSWAAVNDTLKTRIDKQGRQISELRVLEDSRKGAIKALQASNNELNRELGELIKESGRGTEKATIIKTVTEVDTMYETLIRWDTVRHLDTFYLWPVYDSYFQNRWIDLKISATHDTTHTDLTIINDIDITQKSNRKGSIITVRNNNPYSSSTEIKSFAIRRKRRRLGVGVHAGVGVDINGRIVPNVGLAACYHFFQL